MASHKALNNFTGGEWSPFLDGRSDLQKYDMACKQLVNFRPLPWGGASIRSGSLYVSAANNLTANPSRLLPFNYSTSLTFVIEMSDGYNGAGVFQFYYGSGFSAGTQVTAPAVALNTWASSTPYTQNTILKGTVSSVPSYLLVLANFTSSGSIATDITNGNLGVIGSVAQFGTNCPVQIVSPYPSSVVFAVKAREINAVVYLVHPSYPVYKLIYSGTGYAWTLGPVAWKYPALLNQNIVQADLITIAALSGSTTMTASGAGFAPFVSGHVGSYWELQQLRNSSSVQWELTGTTGVPTTSASLVVQGDWTFSTSQYWYGTVQLQASYDNGVSWQTVRQFTSSCDANFSTSGTELAPNIGYPQPLYQIVYTPAGAPFSAAVWVGAAPTQYAQPQATLATNDAYIAGLVQVTGYVSSTVLDVEVIVPPNATTAGYLWSEGSFSAYRGYPAAVDFYEQRMLYSGTAFQPNTLYGSVIGDFDNFQYGDADDAAVNFQPAVAQQNPTQWMASLLRIHMGTSGEELIASSGNLDEPITPSNITIRRQSTYGSANLDALLIHNSILFVERNGQRVREMRELSPYVVPTDFIAPDLTLLAEHITKPGLVQMDFGILPDPLVYTIRSDGVMPVLTYNKEQNITAWSRYVTSGLYQSVAVVYGSPADIVWTCVLRTINGVPTKFIEVFTTDPGEMPDKVNNCLLDCATAVTQSSSTTVSGLAYLNGMTVNAVCDGNLVTGLLVSAGEVTLPVAAVVVRVGLPYVATLQTMKMDQSVANGTTQGKQRRVSQVVLRLLNSSGGQYKSSADPTWYNIPVRTTGMPLGSSPPLQSQDIPIPWPNGIDFDGSVSVQQNQPFPFCVLGIFPKTDAFGD